MNRDVDFKGFIEVRMEPAWLRVSIGPQGSIWGFSSHALELSEGVAVKSLSRLWNVHPKASLSANRAGSLDLEADDVGRVCRSWHIEILFTGYVGSTIVVQR